MLQVIRLISRYRATGSVSDRPRSGRPRSGRFCVTTPAQDRFLKGMSIRSRFRQATETAQAIPGLRRIVSNC